MTERTAAEALAEAVWPQLSKLGRQSAVLGAEAILKRLDAIGWHLTMTDDLK